MATHGPEGVEVRPQTDEERASLAAWLADANAKRAERGQMPIPEDAIDEVAFFPSGLVTP